VQVRVVTADGCQTCHNTNVEIKTLVSPEISDAILCGEHKGKHALIAFRQNVEALDFTCNKDEVVNQQEVLEA